MSYDVGYCPGGDKPAEASNHGNGSTGNTVLTEDGPLRIEVPRDREGSLWPLPHPSNTNSYAQNSLGAVAANGFGR